MVECIIHYLCVRDGVISKLSYAIVMAYENFPSPRPKHLLNITNKQSSSIILLSRNVYKIHELPFMATST